MAQTSIKHTIKQKKSNQQKVAAVYLIFHSYHVMNEGISKQILCVYISKELFPTFTLLVHHNLQGVR